VDSIPSSIHFLSRRLRLDSGSGIPKIYQILKQNAILRERFVSGELKSDLINDILDLLTESLERTSHDIWNDYPTFSKVFLNNRVKILNSELYTPCLPAGPEPNIVQGRQANFQLLFETGYLYFSIYNLQFEICNECLMGGRLTAGLRTLDPSIEVRILAPQPVS
jgi:hypothetical protein